MMMNTYTLELVCFTGIICFVHIPGSIIYIIIYSIYKLRYKDHTMFINDRQVKQTDKTRRNRHVVVD